MFLKKKKPIDLVEAPLNYWEEKSYMLVIPDDSKEDFMTGIFERVSKVEGIEVKETQPWTFNESGKIKFAYENEEYEVQFYPSEFSVPASYITNVYSLSEDEKEKIMNAHMALTIVMEFHKDFKQSYHLQLKLAVAMIPNLLGIMDESAEKFMSAAWAIMAANSKVTPGPNNLYTVQAVSGENGEVWLHTHGLCRCGLTELEILESDRENYNNHYHLISTYASYLIDKKGDFNPQVDSAYIGVLSNRQPIVVTCVPWTKGLQEYKKLTLGGVNDRKDAHNSKTSLLFIYKSESDEKQHLLSKVSEYNDLWGENPIFFISDEETARMKELAIERFNFVKEQFTKEANKIIIKIGIPVDEGDNLEHIWFELIELNGERFKAKLTQEPYNVRNMHEGDEAWYCVDDITDWIIYTPDFTVTPSSAYMLMKNNE